MRVLDVNILVLSSRSNGLMGEFKSKYPNWVGYRNFFGFLQELGLYRGSVIHRSWVTGDSVLFLPMQVFTYGPAVGPFPMSYPLSRPSPSIPQD